MEKYIPFDKLSKKAKKESAKARRGSWGSINPVTRKSGNPKAYNRKQARREKHFHDGPASFP